MAPDSSSHQYGYGEDVTGREDIKNVLFKPLSSTTKDIIKNE